VAAQCALGRDRTGERVTGTWERVEERIALRVNLGAAGSPEGFSHNAPVVPRDDRIGLVPHLLQEARRALDVGEGERDCACVLRHGRTVLIRRHFGRNGARASNPATTSLRPAQ